LRPAASVRSEPGSNSHVFDPSVQTTLNALDLRSSQN
jgi:hypothetical protein